MANDLVYVVGQGWKATKLRKHCQKMDKSEETPLVVDYSQLWHISNKLCGNGEMHVNLHVFMDIIFAVLGSKGAYS